VGWLDRVVAVVVAVVFFLVWEPLSWLWVRIRNRVVAGFGSGRVALAALTATASVGCLAAAAVVTDPWTQGLLMEVGGALLLFLGLQAVLRGRSRPHPVLAWCLLALSFAVLAVTFVEMHPGEVTSFETELLLKVGGGLLLFVVLEVWLSQRMEEARARERDLLVLIAQQHPETPLWEMDLEGGGLQRWLDDAEAMHLAEMQGALEVPFPSLPYYDDIDLARQEAWEAEQSGQTGNVDPRQGAPADQQLEDEPGEPGRG
jgi:hypothetical protein